MKKQYRPHNPFLTSGYINDDYFCDRKYETELITSALRNGRNITLIAPRKMGKTGLINHIFASLNQHDVQCYYIDIFSTNSENEFAQLFANKVLNSLDSVTTQVFKKIVQFFKSIKPSININSQTGEMEIAVQVTDDLSKTTIDEIFEYLEQSGKDCYFALDEFQQISSYSDQGFEAYFRGKIQNAPHLHFIFAGSREHVMKNMFFSPSRPFYQSTQICDLKEIEESEYYHFAERHFKENNQEISQEVFHFLYEEVRGHTWYIQLLLNRLYEKDYKIITIQIVEQILKFHILENQSVYLSFLQLITPTQAKVLHAIAQEGVVKESSATSFLTKYKLGAQTTVNSAVKSLVNKELAYQRPEGFIVYDCFMNIWLRDYYRELFK